MYTYIDYIYKYIAYKFIKNTIENVNYNLHFLSYFDIYFKENIIYIYIYI